MSDSIRAALERLIELRSTDTHALLGLDWHEAFAAAHAALAEQQGEGPTLEEVEELLNRFAAFNIECLQGLINDALARWGHQPARLRNCPTHGQQPPEAWGCPECVRELREELAAARLRQPTPPAEGEVGELLAELEVAAVTVESEGGDHEAAAVRRAAELLQRQHPAPVPVSEGAPGPEDCDVEGRCWWFDDDDDKWCFDTPYMGARLLCWTHWLPAHALPLPQGEVEA